MEWIAGALASATAGWATWWILKRTCTRSITTKNANMAAFENMRRWAANKIKAPKHAELRTKRNDEEELSYALAPGYGTHFLWINAHPAWLTYRASEIGSYGGEDRYENIKLTVLCASPNTLRTIMSEIEALKVTKANDEVSVRIWMGGRWQQCLNKPERSLESVGMDETEKNEIVNEIETFDQSRKWYTSKGLTHRRSYLLSGKPGTGKTSLAFALAAHFKRPLYTMNIGSLRNDDDLITAFTSMKRHGMMLIEDIDAAQTPREITGEENEQDKRRISLSALLNVIDGVLCPPGLVLFMTTNHPDRLDGALARPGRVGRHVRLEALNAQETKRLVETWLGNSTEKIFEGGRTGAEIEQELLRLHREEHNA